MRRSGWALSVAVALSLVAPVSAAAAGALVVRTETTFLDRKQPTTRSGKVMLAGDRLRAEVPAGPRPQDGDVVLVFRGDRDALYVLEPSDRSYVQIDRESVEWVTGQLDAVRGEVRAQMKGMSPETRARMEEVLDATGLSEPNGKAAEIRLVATGKTASTAGRSCREHTILRGSRPIGDACIADYATLGMTRSDLDPARRLATVAAELTRGMPGGGIGGVAMDPAAIAALDGVPIRVRVRDEDVPATETRVLGVERAAVAPEAFAPPPGWRKRSWLAQ
ncbi:MAG TPA: hypothetical protein VFB01_18895 [Burkholderiales bacterium]|nr:hypothetical protein [Burkholderiales bacterium]